MKNIEKVKQELKTKFIEKFELSNLPNYKYFEFLMCIDKIFEKLENEKRN